MALLVQGFDSGVNRVVDPLVLQTRQHALGNLGRPDSLFLDILVMPLWFSQDPLERGRYSFVGEHLTSSTVLVEGDPALSGRCIVYSHSKTGGFVGCSGMGSVGRGPSI